MITTDIILSQLKEWVEEDAVIDAHQWINEAQKLNVLISEEHAKLFNLQQIVAKNRVELIEKGDTVAKAKAKVEAMDIYKEACIQKAKIDQIEEMIRIAKIQARLKDNEYRNN